MVLLCEDRRSESFLEHLCRQHGVKIVHVHIAPQGEGAASAWVIKQFADRVRQLRAKKNQRNLGLLVHVDGDDVGVVHRLGSLSRQLEEEGLERVADQEPIGVIVPTWSIETWTLHLVGRGQPPENVRLKGGPRTQWASDVDWLDQNQRHAFVVAARAWGTLAPAPPSLEAARLEAGKVGIC